MTVCAILALVALFFARPHQTPGPAMRDFEAYYAAGTVYASGGNPYGTQIWNVERTVPGVTAHRFELLPFVSPPATLPFWSWFARFSFADAAITWRVILILAAACLNLLALRLCGIAFNWASIASIVLCFVGFGPATSAVALGQLALPAFAVAVSAFALAETAPPLSAVASAIAWSQPNIALTLIAQLRVIRGAVAFFSGFAIFVACNAALAGTQGLLGYWRVLAAHGVAERFSAIQITPGAVAYGFGAPSGVAASIGIACTLLAVLAWIALMLRSTDRVARFCLTCTLLPFALPFFHEHDLIVAFIPAIVLAVGSRSSRAAATGGAILVAVDWLGLAQRPDGALQTCLLAGAFAGALLTLPRQLTRGVARAAVAVLALVAIAAIGAQYDRAPIWPDAMRPLSAAAYRMPAADVWRAETAATGLFDRNAGWALLRSFSLAGCGLLTYAAARYRRS